MHMLKDQIVPISADREKFFGCSGQMLLPSQGTVAAAIKEIPSGKVATLDLLRSELARRAGVEAVCPFQTKQAIRAIAGQSEPVPFWRLVRKNGEMLNYLPGGSASQAASSALLVEASVTWWASLMRSAPSVGVRARRWRRRCCRY